MAVGAVQGPEGGSPEVVKYGRPAHGEQRWYGWNKPHCERRLFLLRDRHTG